MFRVGIDLGGTNIAVGVVDENNKMLAKHSVPTLAARPWQQVAADMGDAVASAAAKAGVPMADCLQIGVGAPGTCNSLTGIVSHAYNLGWDQVPICQFLQDRFHVPVKLSNDANCAALGEAVAGAAMGYRDVVLITLGTGIGSGIIIDGKIYAGMRSAGAELGHTLLVLDGEACTCGHRGCWEAYASATALIRQTRQAQSAHPESLLCQTPPEQVNGRTAFDAAKAGDETALAVIHTYARYLAAGLTNVVNALAPEMILLGGGICNQGEYLLSLLRDYVEKNCFGQKEGAIPEIRVAQLGNDAGILGAAAL